MQRLPRIFLLFCFVNSFLVDLSSQAETLNLTLDTEAGRAELATAVDRIFGEYKGLPGCSVGIFHQGKIVFEKGYGLANLEFNVASTAQNVYELGSISKQFTAACIVLLETQGKLSLDDPVQQHLKEWPVYPQGEVTIQHLLHHSSGLKDYLVIEYMRGNSWNRNFTQAQGLEILARHPNLLFPPGDRYSYSNSNYLVLALIVEQVSGQSLDAYAQANIFEPLGMSSTYFHDEVNRVTPLHATGYTDNGEGYERDDWRNFTAPGDGGLRTNLQDFLKWSNNYQQPSVGGADFTTEMLRRGVLNDGQTHTYALGVEHGMINGQSIFGHNGDWGGFHSMYLQAPEHELAVIALSNNGTLNVWGKAFEVMETLLPIAPTSTVESTTVPSQSPTYQTLSTVQLARHCAHYFDYEWGYARQVYLKDDTLHYARPNEYESKLFPLDENTFEMDGSGGMVVTFSQDAGQQRMIVQQPGSSQQYVHEAYTPVQLSAQELGAYAGTFHARILDQNYVLEVEKDQLLFTVKGETLEPFFPAVVDIFYSAHLGYMRFQRNEKGTVTGFHLRDEALGTVAFERR
ncbi:MAG: serine hydrolase domain-containing protein [Bacteroidota bacterium]